MNRGMDEDQVGPFGAQAATGSLYEWQYLVNQFGADETRPGQHMVLSCAD